MQQPMLEASLIWLSYGVAVLIALAVSSTTVYTWQAPRDRSLVVSLIAVISIAALLATVLLLPVDIAIISSTTDRTLGSKKKWATPDKITEITDTLQLLYYVLYSLDAALCLFVIPFGYFWYEEYDEIEIEEGRTISSRVIGAVKSTVGFVMLVVVLLVLGYFLPTESLSSNFQGAAASLATKKVEKALDFCLGVMAVVGSLLYVTYTGVGLALLPTSFIRAAPSLSTPNFANANARSLLRNRERQRQLELRNNSRFSSKDRRELEQLVREERTLVRRQRLAEEAQGLRRSWLQKFWLSFCSILKPLKLVGGLAMLIVALVLCSSVLITGIDKATHASSCKSNCNYSLEKLHLFQPMDALFLWAAQSFPADYVLMTLLIMFLLASSISGVATVGIRFLWIRIFHIRHGRTAPQALLITTIMLAMIILAINYSLVTTIAPQYSLYGTQTVCTASSVNPLGCLGRPELVVKCSSILQISGHAAHICTPSVMSTFVHRITSTWRLFGVIDLWAQFAFLFVFLLTLIIVFVRAPKLNITEIDEDAEHDEEERLLARSTPTEAYGGTWHNISGRARSKRSWTASSTADSRASRSSAASSTAN
ncbi:putative lysosomal cobalamin transporter [Ceratocystis fimbriata CBS 114723]|uniref:Probable lysosomal cobalamin transporter n=1 Tax=Ceratocystis fimbriata CBS 114723 TaxID=1035309 RepID=A0A2C5X2U7_9PEZI|nr:putative lysosomal cobalamin transporter [Ceratocystis fimbriata CBS 114723]